MCRTQVLTEFRASPAVWGSKPGGSHFAHPFLPFPQCACRIPCDVPTSPSSVTRRVRMPTPATSQAPWCVPVCGKRARTPARSEGRAWVSNHIPTHFFIYTHNLIPTVTPSLPATSNPAPSPFTLLFPTQPSPNPFNPNPRNPTHPTLLPPPSLPPP